MVPSVESLKAKVEHGSKIDESSHPASDHVLEPVYIVGTKLVFVIGSAALACFLFLVDTMVISTAIPRITDEFHSLADVGWYASAYQFGM
ncbi:hypothetical protein ONZ43_g6954 [Nemania bipapillata]|uniref:Uncharacterized protein n=1 Tax=Nemania bipapillata TaxID=110536 RepID=A0ACC2HUK1_9PEZI|nr:hypothetical protein ONZ43_g6954 [Nemania bipapillata]